MLNENYFDKKIDFQKEINRYVARDDNYEVLDIYVDAYKLKESSPLRNVTMNYVRSRINKLDDIQKAEMLDLFDHKIDRKSSVLKKIDAEKNPKIKVKLAIEVDLYTKMREYFTKEML